MPAGDGGIGHSWFIVELTSEHVEPPAPPISDSGGAEPRILGGPIAERFSEDFPGRIHLITHVELPVGGSVTFSRQFEEHIAGNLSFTSEFETVFDGSRANSLHIAKIREDDELILLSS